MKKSGFVLLFLISTQFSFGQVIGEEVEEILPVFGLCLMPDNNTFLTIEADYDGMYIAERDLSDLFEETRFQLNNEGYNWVYYDYWILNNRTQKTPNKRSLYSIVIDPGGKFLAVAALSDKSFVDSIQIFNRDAQQLIGTFKLSDYCEFLSPVTLIKFDSSSKHLLIGTAESGNFSYDMDSKTISPILPGRLLQLIDYHYDSGAMVFMQYDLDEFGELSKETDKISLINGKENINTREPSKDFTRVFTPTEMHKEFDPYYRQSYLTYITTKDGPDQTILYRNPDTFVITSMVRPIIINK